MREATVHLSNDQLDAFGIEEFAASVRDAGLQQVTELQCGRPGCLLVIEVAEAIPADRFSSVPNLEWWEEVTSFEGGTYLCKLAVPALQEEVTPSPESDVSQEELDVTEEGIDVTIVGEQDALSDRVGEFSATGASPLLRSLTDYSGPSGPIDALTPRQREVLTTAFEMGYFTTPREATTEDVATELDVDASTVREHLQRAQHNVFAALLGGR